MHISENILANHSIGVVQGTAIMGYNMCETLAKRGHKVYAGYQYSHPETPEYIQWKQIKDTREMLYGNWLKEFFNKHRAIFWCSEPLSETYVQLAYDCGVRVLVILQGLSETNKISHEQFEAWQKQYTSMKLFMVIYSSVYGPGFSPEVKEYEMIDSLPYRFIKQMLDREPVSYPTNGQQVFNMMYASDVAEATIALLNDRKLTEVGLANPVNYTIEELINTILLHVQRFDRQYQCQVEYLNLEEPPLLLPETIEYKLLPLMMTSLSQGIKWTVDYINKKP